MPGWCAHITERLICTNLIMEVVRWALSRRSEGTSSALYRPPRADPHGTVHGYVPAPTSGGDVIPVAQWGQLAFTRSCAGTVTVRFPGSPPSTIFRRALLLSRLVSFSRFSGLASTWM